MNRIEEFYNLLSSTFFERSHYRILYIRGVITHL